MDKTPVPGQVYRHFKGKLYQIVTIAEHTETKEKLVIYQAMYGAFRIYARPLTMFISEVDCIKYPDAKQKYRFQLVAEEMLSEDDSNTAKEVINIAEADSSTAREVINIAEADSSTAKEVINIAEADLSIVTGESRQEQFVQAEQQCNPDLMEFLEAETYAEKKNILVSIRNRLDPHLVNSIAASLDITVDEGDMDTMYKSLMRCLDTMRKFEFDRNR